MNHSVNGINILTAVIISYFIELDQKMGIQLWTTTDRRGTVETSDTPIVYPLWFELDLHSSGSEGYCKKTIYFLSEIVQRMLSVCLWMRRIVVMIKSTVIFSSAFLRLCGWILSKCVGKAWQDFRWMIFTEVSGVFWNVFNDESKVVWVKVINRAYYVSKCCEWLFPFGI